MSGLSIINWPIVLAWAIFGAYWMFSILYEVITGKYKRVEAHESLGYNLVQRLLLGIALILVVTTIAQHYYPLSVALLPNSLILLYAGSAVSLFGILFAIWARVHLGANWNASPALKKGQTLTRTGPYSIVRHPIYVGVSLGIIRGAIYVGNAGGLVAIALVLLFSYSRITIEEKDMKQRFGNEYDAYSRKVKAFVPGVL